eukprot:TRINITY_DN84750_c0_g1_i2.p1 TRINITY_DN84750_c0_g1~~TRINITY_DN84750_c0_g1_i2.p1  ORF type:complete len:607 (-),score=34.88 TRINITY_DN84750_c0_g1_i2:1046-2866(-)
MFGFLLSPSCKGCKVQRSVYSQVFCGVSNALRTNYGLVSRWLVNRDATFLALLTLSQMKDQPKTIMTTCCNPFAKKRKIVTTDQIATNFAAAVTVCGLQQKIHDDIVDEQKNTTKRWRMRGLHKILQGKFSSAQQTLLSTSFPVQQVMEVLATQHNRENNFRHAIINLKQQITTTSEQQHPPDDEDEQQPTPAAATKLRSLLLSVCHPTAEAFSAILAHTARLADATETNSSVLVSLGHHLGIVVYLFDALEDYNKDRMNGAFNPLLLAVTHTPTQLIQNELKNILQSSVSQIAALSSQIVTHRFDSILRFITVDGIHKKLNKFLTSQDVPKPATGGATLHKPEQFSDDKNNEKKTTQVLKLSSIVTRNIHLSIVPEESSSSEGTTTQRERDIWEHWRGDGTELGDVIQLQFSVFDTTKTLKPKKQQGEGTAAAGTSGSPSSSSACISWKCQEEEDECTFEFEFPESGSTHIPLKIGLYNSDTNKVIFEAVASIPRGGQDYLLITPMNVTDPSCVSGSLSLKANVQEKKPADCCCDNCNSDPCGCECCDSCCNAWHCFARRPGTAGMQTGAGEAAPCCGVDCACCVEGEGCCDSCCCCTGCCCCDG